MFTILASNILKNYGKILINYQKIKFSPMSATTLLAPNHVCYHSIRLSFFYSWLFAQGQPANSGPKLYPVVLSSVP